MISIFLLTACQLGLKPINPDFINSQDDELFSETQEDYAPSQESSPPSSIDDDTNDTLEEINSEENCFIEVSEHDIY